MKDMNYKETHVLYLLFWIITLILLTLKKLFRFLSVILILKNIYKLILDKIIPVPAQARSACDAACPGVA